MGAPVPDAAPEPEAVPTGTTPVPVGKGAASVV